MASIVKATIEVVTTINIKIANQSFLFDLMRVIATLHNKKTTPHFTPIKAYLTASNCNKFWKNIEMINMMTKGGRTTPNVENKAPKNPPRE